VKIDDMNIAVDPLQFRMAARHRRLGFATVQVDINGHEWRNRPANQ
jgi:hypothetical protein